MVFTALACLFFQDFFSLCTKKIGVLAINAPQSITTWLYIFPTFIATLSCLISDSSDF